MCLFKYEFKGLNLKLIKFPESRFTLNKDNLQVYPLSNILRYCQTISFPQFLLVALYILLWLNSTLALYYIDCWSK